MKDYIYWFINKRSDKLYKKIKLDLNDLIALNICWYIVIIWMEVLILIFK